jgi:hypothetical protein
MKDDPTNNVIIEFFPVTSLLEDIGWTCSSFLQVVKTSSLLTNANQSLCEIVLKHIMGRIKYYKIVKMFGNIANVEKIIKKSGSK